MSGPAARARFRFGTVGAPLSTPKSPGGSVGAIRRTAELGLQALELAWVQSVRVSEATCSEIRQAARRAGIALSIHAPYYINLNAADAEWPKSRKRLMDAAHFGNLAGATEIVFHPGSYFGRPPEQVRPVATQRLQGCVAELRAAGNPVRLRAETMGKSAMLGSLEDTMIFAREVEGVEPCVDFAHLHARSGDGSLNSYDEWMGVFQRMRQALGARRMRRLHAHLSGIEYGSKGERNHLPIRDSDFDLRSLLRALADSGCQGRILCESPILEQDALFIQAEWRRIAGEAA